MESEWKEKVNIEKLVLEKVEKQMRSLKKGGK